MNKKNIKKPKFDFQHFEPFPESIQNKLVNAQEIIDIKSKSKALNWDGVDVKGLCSRPESLILGGFIIPDIKDAKTREKLEESINVINDLIKYMEDNDMISN